MHGRSLKKGWEGSMPVPGDSMNQTRFGLISIKWWMGLRHRSATRRPSSNLRGRVVRARLNSVQGGEAQTASYVRSPGSQSHTSAVKVALDFGSISRLSTSQPRVAKALSTEPVPEQRIRTLISFANENRLEPRIG